MAKALDGVRILDFTHVQSGPTCTQLLAWLGADVIKVERAGAGDITREQLRDIPDVDSLYFTMLNHNKRSITLDAKNPKGKQVLERLVKHCDVLVENFAPGALDRMGFTWERIQELNPRMIVASVKGFGPGPYQDCKVYENVAQCGGGQPGWIIKCKGWEKDPNAYLYFIAQAPVWKEICKVIGKEEWITDPDYATPDARLPRLLQVFATVEAWTMTKTKFEAMAELNQHDIPCGPILSMEELAAEPSLRATGTVVEVDHPKRGKYLTVGNPIKMSDSLTEVTRSPLLGEHTQEVLTELGLSDSEIRALRAEKVI